MSFSVRLSVLLLLSLGATASASTLRVGPQRSYKTIAQVARVARDGDIILLDGGDYSGDVAKWTQNDLVVWAPDGRARLQAAGASAEGKAIWVVEGSNFTAENIEFSGCRVPDRNGAGIRVHSPGKVTLRNCYFHHNENGILGDAADLVVEGCTFDRNGAGDGQTHNLYVWGASVTVRNCYIHRVAVGHNVKTRGMTNYILYNKIADEDDGTGSYSIDVPDCGRTYIIGNVIQHGERSENNDVVSYGAESDKNDAKELYVVNNTFVNDGAPDGAFIHIRKNARVRVVNNIFYGPGEPWVGGNVNASDNFISGSRRNGPRFADPERYDFHLTPDSPEEIVRGGRPPGVSSTGYDLAPKQEYVDDAKSRPRNVSGSPHLGAFQMTPRRSSAIDADLPPPDDPRARAVAPAPTRVTRVSTTKRSASKVSTKRTPAKKAAATKKKSTAKKRSTAKKG